MLSYFFGDKQEQNAKDEVSDTQSGDDVSVSDGGSERMDEDIDDNQSDISEENNNIEEVQENGETEMEEEGSCESESVQPHTCSEEQNHQHEQYTEEQSEVNIEHQIEEQNEEQSEVEASSEHGEQEVDDTNENGLAYKGEVIEFMSYKTLRLHLKELKLNTQGKTHILRNRLTKATQSNQEVTPMSRGKTPQRTSVERPAEYLVSPAPTDPLQTSSVASGTRSHAKSSRKTKSSAHEERDSRSKKAATPATATTLLLSTNVDTSSSKITSQKQKEKENNERSKLVQGILLNKNKENVSITGSTLANDDNSEIEAYFSSSEYDPAVSTRSDQITPPPNTVEFNIAAASNIGSKYQGSSSTTSLDQLDDDMVSVTATVGSTSSPLHFSNGGSQNNSQNNSRSSSSSKKKPQFVELKNSPIAAHSLAPTASTVPTLDSLVGQRFMNVLNDEGPQLTEKEYLFFKSFLDKKKPVLQQDEGEQARQEAKKLADEREAVVVAPAGDAGTVETKKAGTESGVTNNIPSSLKEVENMENVPPPVPQDLYTERSSSPVVDKSGASQNDQFAQPKQQQFQSPGNGQMRHSLSSGLENSINGFQHPYPQHFAPYYQPPSEFPYQPQYHPYHPYPPYQQYPPYPQQHYQQMYQQSPQHDKKREYQEIDADENEQNVYDHDDPSRDEEYDMSARHQHKRRHIDSSHRMSTSGMRFSMGAAPMFQTFSSYEASSSSQPSSNSHEHHILSPRSSTSSQHAKRPDDLSFSNGYTPRFQENVGSFSDSNRRVSSAATLSNIQKRRMKRRLLGSNASVSSVTSMTSSPRAMNNSAAPAGAVAKRILDTLGVLTTSLDDQRHTLVPAKEVQFKGMAALKDDHNQDLRSSGKNTPGVRKVYATTPYRSAAAIQERRVSSGHRSMGGSGSNKGGRGGRDTHAMEEDEVGVDEGVEENRRDSDASVSGQLWSRDQGKSRKSSLSPPVTPAATTSEKFVETLDDTIIAKDSADNEFTFDSPTVCIEGLSEDAVTGVKSRHSLSAQARRSSITFAFSPPAKRRPVTEIKSQKRGIGSSFLFTSLVSPANSIPMAKLEEKSPTAPKGEETSAPAVNSLWSKALSTVKCEVCLVPNDKSATKCVACESPLGATAPLPAPASSSSELEEKKATTSTSAPAFPAAPANSLWSKALNTVKCDVCLVPNEKSATKCVACEGPLGGASVSVSTTTSTVGSSSATTIKEPAGAMKFTFGSATPAAALSSSAPQLTTQAPDAPAAGSKPAFSFGSTPSVASSSTKTASAPVEKPSPTISFGFTSTTATTTADKPPVATFGVSNSSNSTISSGEVTSAPSTSQFGFLSSANKPAGSSTITPAAPVSFAPVASTTSATTPKTPSGFSFGGNATSKPSETEKKEEEKKEEEKKEEEKKEDVSLPAATSKPAVTPSFSGFSSFGSSKEKDVSEKKTTDATSSAPTTASFGSFDKKPLIEAPNKPPTFVFGASNSTTSSEPKKVETSTFKFGGASSAASSTGSSVAKPSFTFGGGASTPAPAASTTSSTFSFGGKPSAGSSGSGTAAPFVFGPPKSSADTPTISTVRSTTPPVNPPTSNYGVDSPGSTMDMGYASGDVSDSTLPPSASSLGSSSFGGFNSGANSSTTFTFGQSGGNPLPASGPGIFGSSGSSSSTTVSGPSSSSAIFGGAAKGGVAAFGSGAPSSISSSTFSFGSGASSGAPSSTPLFGQPKVSGGFGQQSSSGSLSGPPAFGQANSFSSSTPSLGGTPSSSGALSFGAGAGGGAGPFGGGGGGQFGSATPGLAKSTSSASLGGGGGFSLGTSDKSTRKKVKAKRPGNK